ncbi:MAG: asparagine synthase-related protein [Actinomycetota bacterium]
MANFVIIVDPNLERRSRFIKVIEPLLPPVEGLVTHSCSTGDFVAIWAAHQTAPIRVSADVEGAAVIWGEAIPQEESTKVDAATLRTLWQYPGSQAPIFDGYYAAVTYHPDSGLVVGADIIGLFPVYYYTRGEVALVASSPELFRYHPLFKPVFNPSGLVGILLTNGLLDGETLWQGVWRLEVGHLFVWKAGSSPQEVQQYHVSALNTEQKKSWSSLPFADQAEIVGTAFERAIKRQAPPTTKHSILLSGGLDSRTIAGFFDHQSIPTVALTLGRQSDFEVQGATQVVNVLGLEHHTIELPFEEYPSYVERLVKWEHLANGCHRFMFWGLTPHLPTLAPRFSAGLLMDLLIGGQMGYQVAPENISYELFWKRRLNCWGFSPEILEKLLRKEVFGNLVQEKLERIRAIYNSYSDSEFKRGLYFDLFHRQRHHVGSVTWDLCFGAWPMIPCLDLQLLGTIEAVAPEAIGNRRIQKYILCQQFPELAKIPLINNSAFTSIPVLSESPNSLLNSVKWVQQKWRKLENKLGYERRYFCRIYDINRAGWQAVRRQAEPYRFRVQQLFNPETFDELILPPEVRMPYGWDPTESSGVKALLGLMLWSKENL